MKKSVIFCFLTAIFAIAMTSCKEDEPISVMGEDAIPTVTNDGSISVKAATFTVSTIAGNSTAGLTDGTGSAARFNRPWGLAIDAAGNIYVADNWNGRIRKVTSAGVVSTIAESAGPFNSPFNVVTDTEGNIYFTEWGAHRIRKITPAGVVSTIAGSGTEGFADGAGTAAQFNLPTGIAIDAEGNLYVSDSGNNRIRKITPTGVVSTIAGSGTAGFVDGTGTAAQFNSPGEIVIDAAGNLCLTDNHSIRKVTPAGVVTTFAGNGTAGYADGTGSAARFNGLSGKAIDAAGNFYAADMENNRIRKVTPTGVVTTIAGGAEGFADGVGSAARFFRPSGIVIDAGGDLYVADRLNHRIRKIVIEDDDVEIVPFVQIVITRWNNTLTVINNPANNGGYTFVSYKWFRNGTQFATGQSWSAGENGERINASDRFYVEAVTNNGRTVRSTESPADLKN